MSYRTDVDAGGTLPETFRNILKVGGGWGNANGPGLFMIRVIVAGTLSSLFLGITGASIGALIFDTATLPFVVSSIAGYALGAIGFHMDARRKSLRALERYPRLMLLHLDYNFPHRGFERYRAEEMRRGARSVFGGWRMQSMLVASWLSAQGALDRIMQADEEAILAESAQRKLKLDDVKLIDDSKEGQP